MKNVRPIRTEEDYDWAIAEVTKYFEKEPEPGSPDGDRFDLLSDLIEAYEDKHYPIDAPDPVSAIQANMEMAGYSRSALIEVLGSASRASEILNRKRALTMDMVYALHREWHIPAEILIAPYHLAEAEAADSQPSRGPTHSRKSAGRGAG
jgi:HTH-type transcriptional regulator / antitoxin HigA